MCIFLRKNFPKKRLFRDVPFQGNNPFANESVARMYTYYYEWQRLSLLNHQTEIFKCFKTRFVKTILHLFIYLFTKSKKNYNNHCQIHCEWKRKTEWTQTKMSDMSDKPRTAYLLC